MVLLSGTAAAQVANLLSYPLLARLYSPADFGGFAIFIAASAIPGALACWRFDLAVPTAPRWGRHAILWLCIAISIGMGLVSIAGAALYWWWARVAADPLMPPLLGLCVFLTGFTGSLQLYLMRHDCYRISSASLLLRTGSTVLTQIGLAFVWRTPMALVIGYSIGFAAQAILLGTTVWRLVPPAPPRWRHMRALFRCYRRQVSIDIPSTFISALTQNLMTFLLLILFNNRVLGFYALGNRIAIMPLQLFNDALSQVFFQKAARAQEERGEFWNEMKFNILTSGLLSIGVLIGIWLFARPFITIFLGERWAPSATMLLILAPMLAMRGLCLSIMTAVFVWRKPGWLFVHNIASALALCIAFVVARTGGLGVFAFLGWAASLMFVEYLAFALLLVLVSYQRSNSVARA